MNAIVSGQIEQFISDNHIHMNTFDFERVRVNADRLKLVVPVEEINIIGPYGEKIYSRFNYSRIKPLRWFKIPLGNGSLVVDKHFGSHFEFSASFGSEARKDAPMITGTLGLNGLLGDAARRILVLYIFGLSFIFLQMFLILVIIKRATKPLLRITTAIKSANTGSVPLECNLNDAPEIIQFVEAYNYRLDREVFLNEQVLQTKTQAKIGMVASQVAHDIRSPLAALEMLSSSLSELSEEKRTILRNAVNRIRDIANSLSQKREKLTNELDPNMRPHDGLRKNELLMPIVDSIVTEKRLQFRDKLGVNIEFHQTNESYGLFSKISQSEFKRILSNIINNGVEALKDESGTISISLTSFINTNVIEIKDNGRGIPSELLSKIGSRGFTINKADGSGLGVHHAKTTIEAWGGNFDIKSEEGAGTVVKLQIPREPPSDWFVPVLKLKDNSDLIVFDDDQSIHQIWRKRIESMPDLNISLTHLSTPNELRKWYGKNFMKLESAVFLMDYEILNHHENGLDLVDELGLHAHTILVSSRYEEEDVRDHCKRIGIKIIPKPMSGFVPIERLP